ncbi:hypothetical protein SPLC1_S500550 [Arthrospira platensis C1]|nr:hypothetical protein SPLC1_S500550 [Arthrospira platensis C1]
MKSEIFNSPRLLLEVGTIELVGRTSTLKRQSHQTPV